MPACCHSFMTHQDASDACFSAGNASIIQPSFDMIFSLLTLLCLCSDARLGRFLISLGINYASQRGQVATSVELPELLPVLSKGPQPCCDLITGSYSYANSVNFENYLRQLGVAYFLRQLAMLAHPVVTITAKNCSKPTEKVRFGVIFCLLSKINELAS